MGDAEGYHQPTQRAYTPRRNSVPYAFVICMMRGHQQGKAFFEKQELMQLAEDSGLSHTRVFAEAEVPDHGFAYDGWSSMKTLTAKGLVERGGRPVRVSLTPAGRAVAAQLMAELDGGGADHVGVQYREASGETQRAQHVANKPAAVSGARKRKESVTKRPPEGDSDDEADSEEDWEPGKKKKAAKKGRKKKKKVVDDDDDDEDEDEEY